MFADLSGGDLHFIERSAYKYQPSGRCAEAIRVKRRTNAPHFQIWRDKITRLLVNGKLVEIEAYLYLSKNCCPENSSVVKSKPIIVQPLGSSQIGGL